MTKRDYYELCAHQSTPWLRQALDNPTPAMTPMHVKLMRLAIRNAPTHRWQERARAFLEAGNAKDLTTWKR